MGVALGSGLSFLHFLSSFWALSVPIEVRFEGILQDYGEFDAVPSSYEHRGDATGHEHEQKLFQAHPFEQARFIRSCVCLHRLS